MTSKWGKVWRGNWVLDILFPEEQRQTYMMGYTAGFNLPCELGTEGMRWLMMSSCRDLYVLVSPWWALEILPSILVFLPVSVSLMLVIAMMFTLKKRMQVEIECATSGQNLLELMCICVFSSCCPGHGENSEVKPSPLQWFGEGCWDPCPAAFVIWERNKHLLSIAHPDCMPILSKLMQLPRKIEYYKFWEPLPLGLRLYNKHN